MPGSLWNYKIPQDSLSYRTIGVRWEIMDRIKLIKVNSIAQVARFSPSILTVLRWNGDSTRSGCKTYSEELIPILRVHVTLCYTTVHFSSEERYDTRAITARYNAGKT
ncbi:hypothetical protein Trydic_g5008 [Trypoxylus dichotomus]